MEEDDSDREVAIPILTRKPSTGALKPISLDDTEEGASKSASSDQDTEIDKKYELEKNRDDDLELRRDLMHVAIILIISGAVVALNLLGMLFAIPGLKSHLTRKIFTLEEIQKLAKTISNYAHQHIVRTLTVQILLGTWVQTFMIPGATILNMLAGNNFGMKMGLAATMFYNTLGSIFLYLISRSVGRRLVKRYMNDRMESFRLLVQTRTAGITTFNLIIYMTSLRIFPFTPNWFLNVALATLEIPLIVFIPSLIIGLLPYNYLAVSAGIILQDLSTVKVVNTSTSVQLGAVAALGLTLPSIMTRIRSCMVKESQPTVDYYWMQVRKAGQRDEK
mmetsp:Transcript_26951/g.37633  ORF Transcript_26951/g.37633 Transcript_26951/m.37633 type:complete len:334 (-) Transcript_26951:1247-2248(-)